MEVPIYPIIYHYGDNLTGLSVQWQNSDGTPKGDLSGYRADMKIKDKDGVLALTLTTEEVGGGLTINGPLAKVTVSAAPTKMKSGSLAGGSNYLHDLQVKSPDGSIVQSLIKGPFRVDAEQTDI